MTRDGAGPDAPTIDSFVREAAATAFDGHPSRFVGTDRYEVVRTLGEGGFGVVYEVVDRKAGGRMALKLLRRPYAERLYRFKREFRTLAEVTHPNLVRLYEMTADGRDLFITMEVVDGVPLLEHVARSPERARAAFGQLALGLSALHAGKTLHRDIKPSNVMVDRGGRVVLLDLGLALDLDGGDSGELAGTPLYMSPEQCAAERLDEASDWYAVGALLFEALTGRRPFEGGAREQLVAKQRDDAPPPSRFASGVPDDLDRLCHALLRRDPAARPRGDEVLRSLRAAPARRPDAGAPFVGRLAELAALHAHASARACRVLLAHGPSGIGKTALLRRFLGEIKRQHPDTVLLAGRCYERESVPYKALDSVCDALARYLRRLPELEAAALLPREATALTWLFPVMRQVPVFRQLAIGRADGDPAELRARGAAALRELLSRLADRRSVLVCIDDLQWGDADSASLLADLTRGPDAPAVLWLASFRAEEASTSPLLIRLARLRESSLRELAVEELSLGPLDAGDARALASALLAEVGGDAARAGDIARESGGSPFFVHELARRAGPAALGELVSRRVVALDGAARRILEVVAVAARPIAVECVAAAATVAGDELRDGLARLRVEHLVRGRDQDGDHLVESYHDRIRAAVAAAIEPARLRQLHLELAAALELRRDPDAAEIGQHLAEGGDPARAFGYMVRAAEKAEAALAFEEAVRLYRRARGLRGERDLALELAFADALSTAGHGVEASRVWLAVLDEVDEAQRLDLHRRAAEELLVSGHLDEGWAAMSSVLGRLGLSAPRSTGGAIVRVVLGRTRRALFGRRFRPATEPVGADELARLHTIVGLCWSAWLVNPLFAAAIQQQYLPLALASGDREHAMAALLFEALVSAGDGAKAHERTGKLVEETRAIAAGLDVPSVATMLLILDGTVALMEGRWAESYDRFGECERRAAELGAWPGHGSVRMIASTMQLNALFWQGRAGDVLRGVPPALQRADERGHLTGRSWLRMMEGWALGCAGRVGEARAVAADMRARLPERGFELLRWYGDYLPIQLALVDGDAAGAWGAVVAARKAHRFALTSQPQRIFGWWLTGAAAIAHAARGGDRGRMLGEARRSCARIEGEPAPWARGIARGLAAGVASLQGDRDLALRLYGEAAALCDEHHLELAAAAAGQARGRLLGGDDGRALCDGAAARIAPQLVSREALWAHLPGGWEP